MAVIPYMSTGIFDHGAISQLAKTLKKLRGARPFIVTDPGIKAAGLLDKVLEQLDEAPAGVFADTLPNPEEAQAEIATAAYKESGADSIIGLGGGSSLDMSKMVGLMATHEGPYDQYGTAERGTRLIKALPPLIAVPTTSGTGSEVSAGFMVTMKSGRKELFVSPRAMPATAICDPDLTFGLPPHLTAATGMDAVTHCIESIISPSANPVADAIGLDGVARAVGQGMLKRATEDGSDPDARWNMMLASYEGALAFVKGLGAVHSLSHGAGRLTDLRPHHGTLNAIWLPHVLRFNADAPNMEEPYARIRTAMGLPAGADLGDAIAELNEDLGIPAGLKALGFDASRGAGVVKWAMKDLATFTNPKPLEQADFEALYEAAMV